MQLRTHIAVIVSIYVSYTYSYFEPLLPLGTTHILDGGVLRPRGGWYTLIYSATIIITSKRQLS